MTKKNRKSIKCEGRFPQLREEIEIALELIESPLDQIDLNSIFELLKSDFHENDVLDNYFNTKGDALRLQPEINPASLVPLISRKAKISPQVFLTYLDSICREDSIIKEHLQHFMTKTRIYQNTTQSDYLFETNFGIGRGPDEKIVSDSPFNFEFLKPVKDQKPQLALVVGFWYRKRGDDNILVIDQIQDVRNEYIKDLQTKDCITTSCNLASKMGFDEVWMYSAKNHPMFRAHPERRQRMQKDLEKIFNATATDLDFDGSPDTFYTKSVRTT